jgi:hypothetical protein
MSEINIYELVKKFNDNYADKFPNYILLIEAHHMVSYIKASSIIKLGTFTSAELAADKVNQFIERGQQAWVSEISHRLVIRNIKSNRSYGLYIYCTDYSKPIVCCIGSSVRNYKRYRASLKHYLSEELASLTISINVSQLISNLDVQNNQNC